MRWTRDAIYHGLQWDPKTAARQEALVQSRTAETEDSGEGIKALLDRRTSDFKGG